MSNGRQILAMLKSHAEGNTDHFYSIALQVAAAEARQGRRTLAQELRETIQKARNGKRHELFSEGRDKSSTIQFARPRGDAEGLFELRLPKIRLPSVVLDSSIRRRLDYFAKQQVKRSWLREQGKRPNCKILFTGPPGTGKSMTAEALAGSLHLPLFVIRLESLITRYMGETSAKLRVVFDEIAGYRGVYLFDEFDAVGGKRDADNDVAEMRRVLNSFLQFMEEPNSTDSPVAAATNFAGLLDNALLRRFDIAIKFPKPTGDQIKQIIKAYVSPARIVKPDWKSIVESASGLSQSEIARATENAVNAAILDETRDISSEDLKLHLDERADMRDIFSSKRQGESQ